jgi:cytochrome b involved in lipid metabolism
MGFMSSKMQYGGLKKEYTMKEVKKHNTKKNAWIVLYNNVYDITEWIPKHPGGPIIERYIGKDGTKAFESVGHPPYVLKKVVKPYWIGRLKH